MDLPARRPGRPGHRPRWITGVVAAAIAALLGCVVGVGFAAAINRPRVDSVLDFRPGLVTQLYDRDGEVYATFARERRVLLRDGELPAVLQNAILAAEDSNFLHHGGIDAEGIARAALQNMVRGEIVQGASTITMQLARHLFLTRERTWRRKVEEAFLSVELEKTLSKQQILTLYCNVVFLGHGNYGMSAAARYYFGKSVGELTVAEAATLAGIIQQPSRFSPYHDAPLVIARRDHVLRRMLEERFIDGATFEAAREEALSLRPHLPESRPGQYFAEDVRLALAARHGADAVVEEGLQVRTTLDLTIQRGAERAVRDGLARLDHRKGWRGPARTLSAEELAGGELPSWQARELLPGSWAEGIVIAAGGGVAKVKIGDATYELSSRGIGWTGRSRPSELLKPSDVAWFRWSESGEHGEGGQPFLILEQEPGLEGAAVVIESATGAVRAMVGGWSYDRSKFNRITQARRQVGSAFKPFVFGAALEAGLSPADTIFDAPAVFAGADGLPSYSPRNYYRRYYGIITLRRALEDSVNVAAVKLMAMVGTERVLDFTRRCGVTSELPPYPSLALGAADLIPLEVAAAYATIANQGVYVAPYLIDRVTDEDGRLLEEHRPRITKAQDAAVSYVLAHMLEGVIDRGTGARLADLDLDLAGKTGTTDDYSDAWFVGFTPRHTILTWVGYDQKRSIGRNMTGAEAALPMWRLIVERGLDDGWITAGERFEAPPGVAMAGVDLSTGLLPAVGSDQVLQEAFVPGTEPARRWDPSWRRILALPWFQQRAYYLPKEGERMPDDIRDWSRIEASWAEKERAG